MADQKPILRWSRIDGHVEGDCACPDTAMPSLRSVEIQHKDIGEQDCACPDTGAFRAIPLVHQSGLWHLPHYLYRAPLPDSHQVVFVPALSTGIAVLNEPASRILDAFAEPHSLSQVARALSGLNPVDVWQIAWDLAYHGLLQSGGEGEIPCQIPSHTFTAWLHITNQCNAGCTYCYVAKSNESMDEATGRAAIEAVFRSASDHGFRAVKLKYAGGEPTLNFPLVRALHDRAQILSERHGLELREVILSNGLVLSDVTIRALRGMGIRLAISLDGINKAHDTQRGRGTFVQVSRSVDRAIALGLRPHISITVTAQSVGGLTDLVAYILDRKLSFNLNFYREHSCISPSSDMTAENRHLIENLRRVLALIQDRLPRQSIIGGLMDRANLGHPHNRPCGVGQSYAVIDHRGHIARCHMEMGDRVGDIWLDDLVTAIHTPKNGWRNLEVDAKRECNSCTWRYWCAGGCPLLTQRITGRDDGPSPHCEVYRTLFPELLRLEGLRLLKWDPPIA